MNNALLAAAQSHMQAGQLAEAETLCHQILQQQPHSIEALSWLALIAEQTDRLADSVAYYEQILQQAPHSAETHSNLGSVLCKQGRRADAIAHHQKAVALMPQDAEAYYNLGVAFYEDGQLDPAIAQYQQAIALNPQHANAHNNLGIALSKQGNLSAAIDHYQQAVTLNPEHINAHNSLGVALFNQGRLADAAAHYQQAIALNPQYFSAHNNLGIALQRQGKRADAIAAYQTALAIKPDYASAYDNLGTVLQEQGKLEDAIVQYRRALAYDPACANAYNNLGSALKEQGNLNEAIACCLKAIQLQPNHADAHNNYASTLVEQGKLPEAIAHYEHAIRCQPEHINAHLNLGIVRLMQGDFQRGFKDYHWRWRSSQCPSLRYPNALWDGSDLYGRTILLTAEQGFGDTIQFARYAALVAQRGGRVLLACPKPLVRLLSTVPGVDRCIDRDGVDVETHVHAPLLDLPMILGTTLDTIPAEIPYLFPPAPLTPHSTTPHSLRIGFVWASNPDNSTSVKRSCALSYFLALAEIPGVTLYSLQKDAPDTDLEQLRSCSAVEDLREQLGDFADTAAAIAQLDLVISVDTAVAHLAGALGKPVWTLLPAIPDWRWMLHRSDTPWYPTMRLFRQMQPGDWEGVFQRVAAALRLELKRPTPLAPVETNRQSASVGAQSCRHGTLLFNSTDAGVGRSLDFYGEWRENELALLQHLLRAGDVALEVNANLGAHTVSLAKWVGPTGRVWAIEPQRLLVQTLCANLVLNRITNVQTLQLTLGDTMGFEPLPLLDYWQSQGDDRAVESVQRATIDSFSLTHCRLLKLNQPETGLSVIKGAIATLQRCQPVLYLSDQSPQMAATLAQLLQADYDLYWHSFPLYNPNNHRHQSHNLFGDCTATNILGLHRHSGITVNGLERVSYSPSAVVV